MPTLQPPSIRQRLLVLRIIWAALMLGQLITMVLLLVLMQSRHTLYIAPNPVLTNISFAFAVIGPAIAFMLRSAMFRRGQKAGRIDMPAYRLGNIVFWAWLEGCTFLALITMYLNQSLWPTLGFAIILMGLQALTFPLSNRVAGL